MSGAIQAATPPIAHPAAALSPRGSRPLRRAMFVLAQVSSMKTGRSGSGLGCISPGGARRGYVRVVLPGRADRFFQRQPEPGQRPPDRHR